MAIVGGEVPTLRELGAGRYMAASAEKGRGEVDVRSLLRPVIQKNATDEQVDEAAKKVEAQFEQTPAAGREVGAIARRIIDAGKLENYGTKRAQEYLQKWARKYGQPARPNRTQPRGPERPEAKPPQDDS